MFTYFDKGLQVLHNYMLDGIEFVMSVEYI